MIFTKFKVWILFKVKNLFFGRKNGKGVIVKDAFNFDSLFEILPPELKKKSLYPKKIVSQIASVMYVYNFRLDEMSDILSPLMMKIINPYFMKELGLPQQTISKPLMEKTSSV